MFSVDTLGASSEPLRPDATDSLVSAYVRVRAATEALTEALTAEDQQLQSMPLCSPTKWHRGHTTWFFDTFLLEPQGLGVASSHYKLIFNSYYEALGPRHPRPSRGILSRPTAAEVTDYRRSVDERLVEWVRRVDPQQLRELRPLMDLGLAHEQQHQELLLTDILHAFAQNPLHPAYRSLESSPAAQPGGGNPGQLGWAQFEGGLVDIGAPASAPFVFDNERPRHRVWLEPFTLSTRLVTVEEMKAFIDADGYRTPSLWLSDGYDWVRAHGVEAPLYWHLGDVLRVFGLDGLRQPDKGEPVAHVSYYEADAVARFLGARLPTEQEWEAASASAPTSGNFRESGALRPLPAARPSDRLSSMFGNAWEWTQSSYAPYPGYRPGAGALGEYNGKFMVNQHVLRGGSCLTPAGHVRPSYRNFWHPETRFQMTGIRLAKSL